jgi:hypothetical protein
MSWLGQIKPHRRDEDWSVSASLWQTFFAKSVGAQVPLLVEVPLSACACKNFNLCTVDHLCTCTVHSGVKKAHDWETDQIADLFRTTHKVKTQQVDRNRGQRCGDIEPTGLVPLVLDLRIVHDRFGSSSDPSLNGHLHDPNDLDGPLNEDVVDKIRQYRVDYNNRPSNVISFMSVIATVRLDVYIVNLCAFYFCRLIGNLRFFCSFRSSSSVIQTTLPFSSRGFLLKSQIQRRTHPYQVCIFTYQFKKIVGRESRRGNTRWGRIQSLDSCVLFM